MTIQTQEIINKVNAKMISLMEVEGVNWSKSWSDKGYMSVDKHHYSGFNTFWLSTQPFDRKVYGTFLQWNKKGCKVKAGSKAINLLFYKTFKKEVEGKDGKIEDKFFPMLKTFSVFNIEQVEGDTSQFNDYDIKKNKVTDLKVVEDYISNLEASISHDGGSRAFYRPSTDSIHMPSKDSFLDTKNGSATSHYYSVLFHELTHWTGNDKRLNRDLHGFFGNPSYAFEELVAELGSAYQCAKLNIDNEPRVDHAQYLNSWIKAIKDNDKVLLKASSLANKAVGYMDILQEHAASEALAKLKKAA
jgi:antirestriction protein ArdC